MGQIAELDRELSQRREVISVPQQQSVLVRCAYILDQASEGDEHIISHAVHLLIRKHGIRPEYHWPAQSLSKH